jgi:hypothetical protein
MDNVQHMHGENGNSECERCGWNGHRHWRHVIIRILVALFIFWCGVQFGELKAIIQTAAGYGYGSHMMGWGTELNQGYVRAPMMLYTNTYSAAPQATTPGASAVTTK